MFCIYFVLRFVLIDFLKFIVAVLSLKPCLWWNLLLFWLITMLGLFANIMWFNLIYLLWHTLFGILLMFSFLSLFFVYFIQQVWKLLLSVGRLVLTHLGIDLLSLELLKQLFLCHHNFSSERMVENIKLLLFMLQIIIIFEIEYLFLQFSWHS
jgi:hypothetical protein